MKKSDSPGPGQYQDYIHSKKTSSRSVSFGRQIKPVDKSHEVPGPGAYNQTNIKNSLKKVAIGRSQRFTTKEYAKETPGPGKYQSRPSSATTKVSFSKNVRNCTEISHIGEPGRNYENKLSWIIPKHWPL